MIKGELKDNEEKDVLCQFRDRNFAIRSHGLHPLSDACEGGGSQNSSSGGAGGQLYL
jgi:hypothetical protein